MESTSERAKTDRLKILLVLTSTAGGAGLQSYLLAKYLPREEFELTVAFGEGYPLDAKFSELGIPIVHLSFSRKLSPLRNLKAFFEVYRLIKEQKFQVACMACSVAGFFGRIAAWLAAVPCRVFIIHAYASRPNQPKLKRNVFRLVERLLDRCTTHYIAVSEATKRFGVSEGIMPAGKVRVIHNGIEFGDAAKPSSVRADLGISQDSPIVGIASRLEPQKGVAYFIQAAVLARKRIHQATFLIVGSGPLEQELKTLAESGGASDYVKFAGWREDVPEVLNSIDLFCLPSLWEQFPLGVLEAMSMGKAVVASDVDGVSEAVSHGKTGLLVPPASPETLSDAIVALLSDSERCLAMGEAGRNVVLTKFHVEHMVRHYENFFRSLYAVR